MMRADFNGIGCASASRSSASHQIFHSITQSYNPSQSNRFHTQDVLPVSLGVLRGSSSFASSTTAIAPGRRLLIRRRTHTSQKKRRRIQQAKDSPSSLGCSDPQQKQFDGTQAPLCRRCGLLHHTSLGRPPASTSSYRSPKHQREASRSAKRNADQAELISALEVEIAQLERRSELERSLRSNKLAVFHWLCSSNSRLVFALLLASNTLRKQPCSNRHSLRWTPS
jgi:hypothetical protein